MARPDPIQYAERLYGAIRVANFSPISFLAFGTAIKDGIPLRNMPRLAAEPFMRVVGEMLDLEEETADQDIIEAAVAGEPERASEIVATATSERQAPAEGEGSQAGEVSPVVAPAPPPTEKRRGRR